MSNSSILIFTLLWLGQQQHGPFSMAQAQNKARDDPSPLGSLSEPDVVENSKLLRKINHHKMKSSFPLQLLEFPSLSASSNADAHAPSAPSTFDSDLHYTDVFPTRRALHDKTFSFETLFYEEVAIYYFLGGIIVAWLFLFICFLVYRFCCRRKHSCCSCFPCCKKREKTASEPHKGETNESEQQGFDVDHQESYAFDAKKPASVKKEPSAKYEITREKYPLSEIPTSPLGGTGRQYHGSASQTSMLSQPANTSPATVSPRFSSDFHSSTSVYPESEIWIDEELDQKREQRLEKLKAMNLDGQRSMEDDYFHLSKDGLDPDRKQHRVPMKMTHKTGPDFQYSSHQNSLVKDNLVAKPNADYFANVSMRNSNNSMHKLNSIDNDSTYSWEHGSTRDGEDYEDDVNTDIRYAYMRLKEQSETTVRKYESLKREMRHKESQREGTRHLLNEARNQVEQLSKQYDDLKSQLHRRDAKEASLTSDYAKSRNRVDDMCQRYETIYEELKESKETQKNLSYECGKAKEQFAELSGRHETLQEDYNKKEEMRVTLAYEHLRAREELEQMTSKFEAMQKELKHKDEIWVHLSYEYARSKQQLDQLSREHEQLTKENKTLKENAEAAAKEKIHYAALFEESPRTDGSTTSRTMTMADKIIEQMTAKSKAEGLTAHDKKNEKTSDGKGDLNDETLVGTSKAADTGDHADQREGGRGVSQIEDGADDLQKADTVTVASRKSGTARRVLGFLSRSKSSNRLDKKSSQETPGATPKKSSEPSQQGAASGNRRSTAHFGAEKPSADTTSKDGGKDAGSNAENKENKLSGRAETRKSVASRPSKNTAVVGRARAASVPNNVANKKTKKEEQPFRTARSVEGEAAGPGIVSASGAAEKESRPTSSAIGERKDAVRSKGQVSNSEMAGRSKDSGRRSSDWLLELAAAASSRSVADEKAPSDVEKTVEKDDSMSVGSKRSAKSKDDVDKKPGVDDDKKSEIKADNDVAVNSVTMTDLFGISLNANKHKEGDEPKPKEGD